MKRREFLATAVGAVAGTMVLEEVRAELVGLEQELNRRRYLEDPSVWIEEKLGEEVWSKQREILQSVVHNRRTAVPSCFGSGKSWTAPCSAQRSSARIGPVVYRRDAPWYTALAGIRAGIIKYHHGSTY